jgi:hypothetical protein
LSPTYKEQLIKARIGQGKFRIELEKIETCCRLTGVSDPRFLIASHIKPWKDSTDEEKLDGHNGLLLSPHIDKLFDKGYITFKPTGAVIVENKDVKRVMKEWNIQISTASKRTFTMKQKIFLQYHAAVIFEPRQKLINNTNILRVDQ